MNLPLMLAEASVLTRHAGEVTFVVMGKPETAGSKKAVPMGRSGRWGVVDDNPRGKKWKAEVARVAEPHVAACRELGLYDAPLRATFVFFQQRPKGHYGTGRNAQVLKPSAPLYPATRPDALKLARAVEDALSGVLYHDDGQIVREVLEKHFGEPRVQVTLALAPGV